MDKAKKVNSRLYLGVYLGLLSAFGPFVMDMYVSAFPQIAAYYDAVPSMVQLSLSACTLGLALGQLAFGVVSDHFGRKGPLMVSLIIYLAATVGCLEAPTVQLFVAMRFFEGLSAAGGLVISRSVAADCYSGMSLARMFGVIGMINGVSTVLSPMLGGLAVGSYGWHVVFGIMLGIGVLMAVCALWLRESLPAEKRLPLNVGVLVDGVRGALRNGNYVLPTLQYAFIMSMIFVNISSGSFIMSDYGLGAEQISLVFGANAVGMGIAAAMVPRFRSLPRVVSVSGAGMLVGSVSVAASLLLGLGFVAYAASVFVLYAFVGAMCTATTSMAMEAESHNAGIASALFGAVGQLAGTVASPIIGLGDVAVSTSVMFVVLAVGNVVLWQKSLSRRAARAGSAA